jgi:hypothetical protein
LVLRLRRMGMRGGVLDLGTGEREREGESVKKRKLGYIVLENEVGKEDEEWRPQKPGQWSRLEE